jgi:hypothetical protein
VASFDSIQFMLPPAEKSETSVAKPCRENLRITEPANFYREHRIDIIERPRALAARQIEADCLQACRWSNDELP